MTNLIGGIGSRNRKETNLSLRVAVGMTMVLGGFLMKATLNHNINYWAQVKTWTVVLLIFGLVIVGLSFLVKVDNAKPNKFMDNPGKWILNRSIVIIMVVVGVGVVIEMEDLAVLTNRKLRDYYLSKDTETTTATVIGQIKIPYTIKLRTSYQEFSLIQYSTTSEVIEQGLEERKLIAGRQLRIRYSKLHPSFFRIE